MHTKQMEMAGSNELDSEGEITITGYKNISLPLLGFKMHFAWILQSESKKKVGNSNDERGQLAETNPLYTTRRTPTYQLAWLVSFESVRSSPFHATHGGQRRQSQHGNHHVIPDLQSPDNDENVVCLKKQQLGGSIFLPRVKWLLSYTYTIGFRIQQNRRGA